ncbi:MAG: heavy-metal-associated domain-containing protein [Armatimonadota bacterium]|nr:heavy-metal-associated domain-containing protein [Armatimonadota bacterium]
MKTTTLNVEGMTCEGCANAIRRALTRLEGVSGVEVDLARKRVSVTHDEARAPVAEVRARIEAAGYTVRE